MIKLITAISIVMLSELTLAAPYVPKDEILSDGDWRLVTIVLHKGTPNQKIIEKNEYRGKELVGKQYHSLVTPFGTYVWRSPYDQGYRSGWINIDSDMDVMKLIHAQIDIRKQGDQLFTIQKESQPDN